MPTPRRTTNPVLSLVAVLTAAYTLIGCAGMIVEEIMEQTGAGALFGMLPAMKLAAIVSDYRETFGRCPLSAIDLTSGPVIGPEQIAALEDLIGDFREISLYESPPAFCILEYATSRPKLSELADEPSESGFDVWIEPQRAVIRLQTPIREARTLKNQFTMVVFEVSDDGTGRLSERMLPPLTGSLEKDFDSGQLRYNVKESAEPAQAALSRPPARPAPADASPPPRSDARTARPGPEYRVALVVGNADYASAPLRNPVNDATDVAATLRSLGFDVTLLRNASQREMEEAAAAFTQKLADGGVGLFYYSGHGVEIDGQNYLVPTGASIKRESDAKYRAVSANWILERMGDAGNRLNILVLDACRDNPFERSWRSGARGLSVMPGVSGVLIGYATAPGRTAADGHRRNSPYTHHILKEIGVPGVPIETVFKRVGAAVQRDTGGQQVPWVSLSLIGDFYFVRSTARN